MPVVMAVVVMPGVYMRVAVGHGAKVEAVHFGSAVLDQRGAGGCQLSGNVRP